MRIIHRLIVDREHRNELRRVGIDLSVEGEPLKGIDSSIVLRVDESDERWPAVRSLIPRLHIFELVFTEFSDQEIDSAKHVCFLSKSFKGYPEPRRDREYLRFTYDLKEYCDACGIGAIQRAPFRIAGEVNLGPKATMQLNWIWDEIFVKPEIWERVFRPFGIEHIPVLGKGGKQLTSLVQLSIKELVPVELDPKLEFQVCSKCHRIKYYPMDRGPWPKPLAPTSSIFKSSQWFGDGREASHEMFVSHDLHREMAVHNLNCNYWACAA